jgi:hypothetical protein
MQHFMQLLGSSVISFVQVGQQLYPVSEQQLLRLHILLQLGRRFKSPSPLRQLAEMSSATPVG